MRLIKYTLTATGFTVFLFACCITTTGDDKWYVPMLIGLGGAVLMGIAVLIDYLQRFKRTSKADKPVVKIQNCDYAGEFEKLYNKKIIDEIWQ